jgi:hypothetical protein
MIVFVGHLALALGFTVGLYLAATYSSLHYEINQISQLLANIDRLTAERKSLLANNSLATPQNPIAYCDGQLSYYKAQYNESVANFNIRKESIFSIAVLRLFKKLDKQFPLHA